MAMFSNKISNQRNIWLSDLLIDWFKSIRIVVNKTAKLCSSRKLEVHLINIMCVKQFEYIKVVLARGFE